MHYIRIGKLRSIYGDELRDMDDSLYICVDRDNIPVINIEDKGITLYRNCYRIKNDIVPHPDGYMCTDSYYCHNHETIIDGSYYLFGNECSYEKWCNSKLTLKYKLVNLLRS